MMYFPIISLFIQNFGRPLMATVLSDLVQKKTRIIGEHF